MSDDRPAIKTGHGDEHARLGLDCCGYAEPECRYPTGQATRELFTPSWYERLHAIAEGRPHAAEPGPCACDGPHTDTPDTHERNALVWLTAKLREFWLAFLRE